VANELAAVAANLIRRLRRWDRKSWLVGATGRAGSRSDAAFAAVQRLADIGAAAERRLPRPVPRPSDLALADQLAVLVDDIQRTDGPDAVRAATLELIALRRTLGLR
jgi:hypothetical protein